MGEADALSSEFGKRIHLPVSGAQKHMVISAHVNVGHRGVESTLYELKRSFTS